MRYTPSNTAADDLPRTVSLTDAVRLDLADVDGMPVEVLRLLVETEAVRHVRAFGARYVMPGELTALPDGPDSMLAAARGLWCYVTGTEPVGHRDGARATFAPLLGAAGGSSVPEVRLRPDHISPWLFGHAQLSGFRLPFGGALSGLLDALGAPLRRMVVPTGDSVRQATWPSYVAPRWLVEAAEEHRGEEHRGEEHRGEHPGTGLDLDLDGD